MQNFHLGLLTDLQEKRCLQQADIVQIFLVFFANLIAVGKVFLQSCSRHGEGPGTARVTAASVAVATVDFFVSGGPASRTRLELVLNSTRTRLEPVQTCPELVPIRSRTDPVFQQRLRTTTDPT